MWPDRTALCGAQCLAATVTSGGAAALVLAIGSSRGGAPWAMAALAVASLTAALPCLVMGAAGVIVVPTVWATGIPLVALRRWSAA